MTRSFPASRSHHASARIPARAVMGDMAALVICIAATFGMLVLAIISYADNYGERVILAAGT